MNFLLLGNPNKELTLSIGNSIAAFLCSRGCSVYVNATLHALGVKAPLHQEEAIDMAIVLGGDGTILREAHLLKKSSYPLLGINLGRVGVLAEANPENYEEVLNEILASHFYVEKRVALEGKLTRDDGEITFLAFNEVSLHRGEGLKMLSIGLSLNEGEMTSFYADGLIVATPTGSSAYCLSSGGPLLSPTSSSFVLTPICPQLRTITSLVTDGEDKIIISPTLGDNERKARLEIDGIEAYPLSSGDTLTLCKAKKTLDIVTLRKTRPLFEPIFKVTNTFR